MTGLIIAYKALFYYKTFPWCPMPKGGNSMSTIKGLGLGRQVLQVGETKVTCRISKLLHIQEPRHLSQHTRACGSFYYIRINQARTGLDSRLFSLDLGSVKQVLDCSLEV